MRLRRKREIETRFVPIPRAYLGETVEQRLMKADERRAYLASLSAFGSTVECPKCLGARFHREFRQDEAWRLNQRVERMHVTCRTCGAVTVERCADQEGAE